MLPDEKDTPVGMKLPAAAAEFGAFYSYLSAIPAGCQGHRYQLLLGEGCKLYVRASGNRLAFRVGGHAQDGTDIAKCRRAAARLAGGTVSVSAHFAKYLRALGQSVAPTEFGGLDWIVYGGKLQDRITSAYYAKHPELL